MKLFNDSWRTESNQNAMGGTELMTTALFNKLPPDYFDGIQIVPSRVRNLEADKRRVFVSHDLPSDPETKFMKHGGWSVFHKLVFVSHTQRDSFFREYEDIQPGRTAVIHNAIDPIAFDITQKQYDKIRIIYHTTPHRGLELLYPVVDKLSQEFPNIHLDVYSSFNLYGWGDRDKPYEPLFDKIKQHPNMSYRGAVSNKEVREALTRAHIFAYPSIWVESSCISLIEAMSAGCICVHPNNGALPETASNWTNMYNFHQDPNIHANIFYNMLKQAIGDASEQDKTRLWNHLKAQKSYMDLFYGWEVRASQWAGFLESVKQEPLESERVAKMYIYRA